MRDVENGLGSTCNAETGQEARSSSPHSQLYSLSSAFISRTATSNTIQDHINT